MPELLDLDLLDDSEPFEIDAQAAHLFKHPHLGIADALDAWRASHFSTPPNRRLTG